MDNDHSAPSVKVSIVVPARNEARNLPHVLGALPSGLHEVILVDGHSEDNTIEVARLVRPDVIVVRQTRKGKGNALACGFAAVTGDVVVMLDADGSADPSEIPAFVDALLAGADFAKGTRFARGGGSHDITRLRRLGNAGLNALVNVLFRTCYSDLCYGYNAFWSYMLDRFDLPAIDLIQGRDARVWGDGFEIETLLNVRIAAAGARIVEVASVERERIHGVSNLNAVRDGLRVLRTIVAEWRRAARYRAAANDSAVRATGRGQMTGIGPAHASPAEHRLALPDLDLRSARPPLAEVVRAGSGQIDIRSVGAPGSDVRRRDRWDNEPGSRGRGVGAVW